MPNFDPANFPVSFGTSGIIFTTKRRNSPKQSPLSTKKTFEGNIKDCAPARRADTGKRYFVGHDGQISSPAAAGTAIGLRNTRRSRSGI